MSNHLERHASIDLNYRTLYHFFLSANATTRPHRTLLITGDHIEALNCILHAQGWLLPPDKLLDAFKRLQC